VLFDLDRGASLFQLALDILGFFLGDALFDGGGSGLNQLFSLAQAQGSDLTNGLNHADFVGADLLEADLKFRLVFGSGGALGGSSTGSRRGGDGNWGCGADAEFFFQGLNDVGQLDYVHSFDSFYDLVLSQNISSIPIGLFGALGKFDLSI